jgi:pimeloyl-ACP methyl ester carboxylesterase
MKRSLVVVAALVILWIGQGEPGRGRVPHQAEWLPAGQLQLRVLRAGKGDTTLLLLHGYGESLLTWRLIIDPLARHYRVVALDLPGFGLSDKPDTIYNVAAYLSWLEDFADRQINGPIVAVGHSMGGQLAAQLALARPARIVAAVLVDPAGAGINPVLTDSAGAASTSAQWFAAAMAYVLPMHDPRLAGRTARTSQIRAGRGLDVPHRDAASARPV